MRLVPWMMPLALLTACGDSLAPVGVFATDAAAHATNGFERALPAEHPGAADFARARFAEQAAGAAAWSVSIELRADHGFDLAIQLPAAPQQLRAGTWSLDGDTLQLVTTARNGEALAAPTVQAATLTTDAVLLRLGVESPVLVLQRRPGATEER